MPGSPRKVGKSGDMVWVRSTTRVKARGAACASPVAAAVAAKLAAAPLKKLRRDSACRTASWHPGTHMLFLLHLWPASTEPSRMMGVHDDGPRAGPGATPAPFGRTLGRVASHSTVGQKAPCS